MSVCYNHSGYDTPWLSIWRREKRCCSPDVWPLYFSFDVPAGYFGEADYTKLLNTTSNAEAFREALSRLAEEVHLTGYQSRLSAALEALHEHERTGFAPLDHEEALACLATIYGEVAPDSNPESMGLLDNELRIRWLVFDILQAASEPAALVCRVLRRTGAVYAGVDWLASLEGRYESFAKGERDASDLLVNGDGVEQIKHVVLGKIHEMVDDGSLSEHPRVLEIVFRHWSWWEPEEAKAFFCDHVRTDEAFLGLVGAFFQTGSRKRDAEITRWNMQGSMESLMRLMELSEVKRRAGAILNSSMEISEVIRAVLSMMLQWSSADEGQDGGLQEPDTGVADD
jgi:predicted KAP-like P-loop ATPase